MPEKPYTDEQIEAAEDNASCLRRLLLLLFVCALIAGCLIAIGAYR